MDFKLVLSLGIILTLSLATFLADSRKCHYFDYKKCSSGDRRCWKTKTCRARSHYCFTMNNGTTQPMLHGCWIPSNESQCSQTSECNLSPTNEEKKFSFCCCREDFCNTPLQSLNTSRSEHLSTNKLNGSLLFEDVKNSLTREEERRRRLYRKMD
ncbi:activin receptor type-2B-like isoform X1 [Acropora millepora]|uniref:activin receptor type-2B-like isoform X1 n=1 Tax=Acropora millepora TaxID=45264 RepID=UPI001CF34034|nr:activin receptor type-2B-like isoform X1 [Acropora millepora]XP_029210790.2 activin receptor type-2B-like isoform X1 [Acropora millepora]